MDERLHIDDSGMWRPGPNGERIDLTWVSVGELKQLRGRVEELESQQADVLAAVERRLGPFIAQAMVRGVIPLGIDHDVHDALFVTDDAQARFDIAMAYIMGEHPAQSEPLRDAFPDLAQSADGLLGLTVQSEPKCVPMSADTCLVDGMAADRTGPCVECWVHDQSEPVEEPRTCEPCDYQPFKAEQLCPEGEPDLCVATGWQEVHANICEPAHTINGMTFTCAEKADNVTSFACSGSWHRADLGAHVICTCPCHAATGHSTTEEAQ